MMLNDDRSVGNRRVYLRWNGYEVDYDVSTRQDERPGNLTNRKTSQPLHSSTCSSKRSRFIVKKTQCRGIELVQGLADAADDHLETAKIFLASPEASSDSTLFTNATGEALPDEGSPAVVAGATPSTEDLVRGVRRGRRQAPRKAANQGISAVDLEALIAELLSRQSLLRQAKGAGKASGGAVTARIMLEATAEEVASWLVQELGHRRQVDDTCSISFFCFGYVS